jgi:hypothetical protein
LETGYKGLRKHINSWDKDKKFFGTVTKSKNLYMRAKFGAITQKTLGRILGMCSVCST